MNAPHDTERQLTAWLEDGPSRAPERMIDLAIEHAHAHPRRRDPFALFRKDPMHSTRSAAGLRPIPLIAAFGLLLVAAFAVASVGGLFQNRPAVVPPPAPIASSSPSPSPSTVPSPTASTAPNPVTITGIVELVGFGGQPLESIQVHDKSATLVNARTGQPNDGGSASSPDKADVVNAPGDPTTLIVTWTGLLDDEALRFTIAPDGRTMTIERIRGSGDLLPVDRVLILTFAGPVPAGEVTASIVEVTN
jgi:hypothetical protein